jgi:hypothetical protein
MRYANVGRTGRDNRRRGLGDYSDFVAEYGLTDCTQIGTVGGEAACEAANQAKINAGFDKVYTDTHGGITPQQAQENYYYQQQLQNVGGNWQCNAQGTCTSTTGGGGTAYLQPWQVPNPLATNSSQSAAVNNSAPVSSATTSGPVVQNQSITGQTTQQLQNAVASPPTSSFMDEFMVGVKALFDPSNWVATIESGNVGEIAGLVGLPILIAFMMFKGKR